MYLKDEPYLIVPDKEVQLPIGIERDGKFYRRVILDRWRGTEHERLTESSSRKNPSKLITDLLCRMIQEIPGIVPRKKSPIFMIDSRHVENMYDADRTFLLMQTLALRNKTECTVEFTCPRCREEFEEDIDLLSLKVYPHDPDTDTYIEFDLPDEGVVVMYGDDRPNEVYKRGKFHYPKGSDVTVVGKSAGDGEFAGFTKLMSRCIEMDGYGRIDVSLARMMTSDDREFLYDLVGDFIPGVDQEVTVECPMCVREYDLSVDPTQFFFSKSGKRRRRGKT